MHDSLVELLSQKKFPCRSPSGVENALARLFEILPRHRSQWGFSRFNMSSDTVELACLPFRAALAYQHHPCRRVRLGRADEVEPDDVFLFNQASLNASGHENSFSSVSSMSRSAGPEK